MDGLIEYIIVFVFCWNDFVGTMILLFNGLFIIIVIDRLLHGIGKYGERK
jgi:flagellar motor switch protein FliM